MKLPKCDAALSLLHQRLIENCDQRWNMVQGRLPNLVRRQTMAALRARGLALGQIGRELGVTRQCVQRTLARLAESGKVGRCCACRAELPSPVAAPREKDLLCLTCVVLRPCTPFGQMLKSFRIAAGWTQEELAKRARLWRGSINRFERGHSLPRQATLARLRQVLGLASAQHAVAL